MSVPVRTFQKCLAAVASLALAFTAAGEHTTVSLAGNDGLSLQKNTQAEQPSLVVLSSDDAGLDVQFTLSSLDLTAQKTKGGAFVSVGWPDASIAGEIGHPAIPVYRSIFVAPGGADVSINVSVGDPILINLATAGYDGPLMPVQAPIVKLPGAIEAAPFDFNAQAYAGASVMPTQRATVTNMGIVRGEHLYLLEMFPVAYNPATGTLQVWTDIGAQMRFTGGEHAAPAISPMPGLDHIVLNPDQLSQPLRQNGAGNYLIVVSTTYESGITAFAQAKADQGYTVMTHVVSPGTSASTIKSYIQGLWGTADAPAYVLLVGDTDTIPAWTGGGEGSPDTDLPYGCMDGSTDWFPDIAIGRFSVRSSTHLSNIVEKTLITEDGPWADPEYVTRACFMASVDNYQISEGTHNYVINNHLDPNGIISDKLYQVTYGATTQDVRNSFNGGRIYGVFSGHGSTTSWGDGPPFSQSDVNNLTNAGMYSIVLSFSCSTGDYVYSECFMETWLRAADKAAAASWGSSVSSYWTEDDVLEKVLFDVIYDDGVRELGPCFNATRVEYAAQMGTGSTTRRYFEMYNLMGDPSLYIPVPGGDTDMGVSPFSGFDPEGQAGGPFTPSQIVYTVENNGDAPIQYSVTKTANWLTITNGSGTIPVGLTADVTVAINSNANSLGNGSYADDIQFVNVSTHDGDTTRHATLTIGVPSLVYSFPMDSNPGWTTEGQWAFGDPTGNGGEYGGPDPNNGHTGSNVYGYNLSGDYTNYMPEYDLTTTAIDCSELTEVSVKFWRWLGVEQPSYDHAYIRVSNNGTNWTQVWTNGSEITDSSWSQQEYDISAVANNQSTVYIRWTMGTTDSSWRYCGWNIDDVEIWGLAPGEPPCPEDLNGDGYIDQEDLGILLSAYENTSAGDIDGDGDTDQADLGLLLSVYDTACP
ncbi:MAG: hypothetical protein KAS72_00110 [Phycisphaerales bacterium]|nr:hypothetical protein [Phycisphaerales bacterium]